MAEEDFMTWFKNLTADLTPSDEIFGWKTTETVFLCHDFNKKKNVKPLLNIFKALGNKIYCLNTKSFE